MRHMGQCESMLHARAMLQLSKESERAEACVPTPQALKLCSCGNCHSLFLLCWQGLEAFGSDAHRAPLELVRQRREVPCLHLVAPQLDLGHVFDLGEFLMLSQLGSVKASVLIIVLVHVVQLALLPTGGPAAEMASWSEHWPAHLTLQQS